jgi:hypothetical protein
MNSQIADMLKEETKMRRSPDYLSLKKWASKDNNGNMLSSYDEIELWIQKTVLKKFGFVGTEENRVEYLKECHKLLKENPELVKEINAPHLLYNPFFEELQKGKQIENINVMDLEGDCFELQNLTKNRKTVLVTGSFT